MVKPQRGSPSPTPPPQSHNENDILVNVGQECHNAINIGLKDFPKGLKIANELCSAYRDVPYCYICKAQILAKHATTHGYESKERQKLLNEALEATQFALVLAPKDPSFTYCRATILYNLAKDEAAYSMVVKECRDALQMQPDEKVNKQLHILLMKALNAVKVKRNEGKNENPVLIKPSDQEFITKNGEYWRNLSYDKKCEILDVSFEDLESFFVAGENKNLRAVSVCREAIEKYISNGHWVTWTCCLCLNDKFDDWDAFLKHMDGRHFHDVSPAISADIEFNVLSDADDLDFDDNEGIFILDKLGLVRWLGNDQFANDIFLSDWLRSDCDIHMAFVRWDNRKMEGAQTGLNVLEEIEKLVKEKVDILKQVKQPQQDNMGSLNWFDKIEKAIKSIMENFGEVHKKIQETSKEIEDIRLKESMGTLAHPEGQKQDRIRRLEKVKEEKQQETIDLQKIPSQQKNKNLENPKVQSEIKRKGKSIQDKRKTPGIKMYTDKVVTDKISSIDAKINALQQTAIRQSAFDYRETLMPIIKYFIQARLNSEVEEAAKKKAHAAMEDLVGKVDDKDNIESKKSKKNKKKGKNVLAS